MPATLDLRRLDSPIIQAGMGSVARHGLAAAVSHAGGLGTIAGARAPIARELAAARKLTDRPIAVNLLLPFTRPEDITAAAGADAVITFWGVPRRPGSMTWVHQCGSVQEAKAAAAAGADAVIAQGIEAGGHVRGTTPMLELVERTRAAIGIPVLAAGGIVDRQGVRDVLEAGAVAAVVGTRFLLSEESRAHPDYKQRCLDADTTFITELFGLGWPGAPHRVIANAATRRWLAGDSRGPAWLRHANSLTSVLAHRLPDSVQTRAFAGQRPSLPFFGPQPPTDERPARSVDSSPLYAGVGVAEITAIRSAAQLVAELTP